MSAVSRTLRSDVNKNLLTFSTFFIWLDETLNTRCPQKFIMWV